MHNVLCGWPTNGLVTSTSLKKCMLTCLNEAGCYSFNYSPDNGWCALVVPTAGQETPLSGDISVWEFHAP